MNTELFVGLVAITGIALAGAAGLAFLRLFMRVDLLERQAKEVERHFSALVEIVDSLLADVRQLQRDRDGIGPA